MKWTELGNNIELGIGLLRAVAQGYTYDYDDNYDKIKLGWNFQMNLMRRRITTIDASMTARGGARLQLHLH